MTSQETQITYLRRYLRRFLLAAVCVTLALGSFSYSRPAQAADYTTEDTLLATQNATLESVRSAIAGLPTDPSKISAGDLQAIESIQADYESLSAEEQATLDTELAPDTGQSYGRVLESALWAARSYTTDNSTILADGTYDVTTTPAVSSVSDKGKSTSPRIRNWNVETLTVEDGKATATITVTNEKGVKQTTYTDVWSGGTTYPAAANDKSAFAGVPVDLNATTYFAAYSTSMVTYIAYGIHISIDETATQVTVTFTDGLDPATVIDEQLVTRGRSATEPAAPEREGFVFAGWDSSFVNVAEDITVNATWVEASEVLHTVTFTDGLDPATALKTQKVAHGQAATAPDNPTRDGYTFVAWDRDFSKVTDDLEVKATWIGNDELAIDTIRNKIAELPADPIALMNKTDDTAVAQLGAAYNALDESLQAQIPDDERVKLVESLIIVLPSDSFKVTAAMSTQLGSALSAYLSLPNNLRNAIDTDAVSNTKSYGRHLENAEWAFDSLKGVANATTLPDGVYSTGVSSSSGMGKSTSDRKLSFTAKQLTVENGRLMATIEHSSNSSQTLLLGGVEYQNQQTDPSAHSQFVIPAALNTTFYFSIKGKNATAATDGISYEMVIMGNEATLKPDASRPSADSGEGENDNPGGGAAAYGGTTASGGTSSGGSGGGSAGNLTSLVSQPTTASNANSGTSSNGSANKASGSTSSSKNTTANALSAEADSTGPSSSSGYADAHELTPGIVGGVVLAASLGCLAFVLRFIRRENAPLSV